MNMQRLICLENLELMQVRLLDLVRLCKEHANKIGISFHVGSQCMHKISFTKAINEVGNIIKKTKIIPDIINIGGGFPSVYPDLNPEPLENYLDEIKRSISSLNLPNYLN